jgi:hypothetical protein
MKRFLFPAVLLFLLAGAASGVCADAVALRYGFKPGQQWTCTRLSHTQFMAMGKMQTQRTRHKILYTVSKGPKKGWVHLSARYTDPPPDAKGNPMAMALYDLTFHADVHPSGDTRAVRVEGLDQPAAADPTLDPMAQANLRQGRQMMADSYKDAVFWFPELPEEKLSPGDDFEFKRRSKMGNQMMAITSQSRQEFTLDEVNQGLAYFELREKTASQNKTMGADVKTKSAGKGESIFDLKSGMWIELVIKRKMSVGNLPMAGGGGQEMQMMEKMEMQLN